MTTYAVPRTMFLLFSLAIVSQTASLYADEDADRMTNSQFAVGLTDGSSIVCRPKLDVFPLKTSFAELKIPLHRVESIKIDHKTNVSSLSLLNGDRLQGECLVEQILVDSLVGELKVPMVHVASITTTIHKAPVFEDSPAKKNACINNLRQLDGGKEQWAMASRKRDGDAVDERGVNEYIKGNRTPICPAGGTYTYNNIGVDPQCSVPGHSLR